MNHEDRRFRRPTHPGTILKEDFLKPSDFTQEDFANAIGMSLLSVNQLLNGKRSVTAEMALRLSKMTSTNAEFWLNFQREVDLFDAKNKLGGKLDKIKILFK